MSIFLDHAAESSGIAKSQTLSLCAFTIGINL